MTSCRRSLGTSVEGFPDAVGVGGDEVGVIVEDANLIDRGGARSDRRLGPRDVLAILAATRVGAIGGQDDGQGRFTPSAVISARVSASIGCQFRFPQ